MYSPRNQNGQLRVLGVLFCAALFSGGPLLAALGGPFSSGSTGADGALNITTPGVTYFDPKALNISQGTNVFNFTTVTIASGSILKFSEAVFHGPVIFLASGDVTINGAIDISGDWSPGPTQTAAEQLISFAGSGGYSGGLGGVHGDSNHQALAGNGPAGGAPGDINSSSSYAKGGGFSANRFLVPLFGGSGGGGTNENGEFGSQGGAGGGAILIASSTKILLDGQSKSIQLPSQPSQGSWNQGLIMARGGYGGARGCGGSGGAVRLVANTIAGANNYAIYVDTYNGAACSVNPSSGLLRLEANTLSFSTGNVGGAVITSVPYALNLPTLAAPVITVSSVNGMAVNANPFSFPDATINTGSAVPVVVSATNVPTTSTVMLYILSDGGANQAVPVKLTGNDQSSTGTVNVTFPPAGSRGFVKAVFQ